jgi:cytochrome c oxidase accessory protein FixG
MDKRQEFQESRLATTDESGNRVYIHPEDIKGKWKDRRTYFYWFLIILYLVLPWVYIDGKQWVLLDLAHREFTIFGHMFYGHDGPLLFFLLIGFVVLMAFITSIWGRVWCGWACPQTVFIEIIYRKIEQLIEGKSRQRRDLDRQKFGIVKIFKRILKWFLFLLVSLHIVHSFLGYFVGTRELFTITMHSPSEHWTLFITMLVMTGILLFDFGWFREQFCIIACPYGRFQSVVMDDDSLIVAYDYKRGDPKRDKSVKKSDEGDCISCNHCVKACPTGIDIRNGTQMECISCTMCIDACDNIMRKVNKPEGLIRYTTENKLTDKEPKKIYIRSGIYLIILSLIVGALFFSLSKRSELKAQFIRGSKSSSAYQEVSLKNGSKEIVNYYKLKVFQSDTSKMKLKVVVDTEDNLVLKQIRITMPYENIDMENEDNFQTPIFFNFPQEVLLNGARKIKINFINMKNNKVVKQLEVKIVGPFR